MTAMCVVQMWRDTQWLTTMHLAVCGKPAKGERSTPDGQKWPVCGIHLRAKRGMVQVRHGHSESLIRP